MRSASLVLIPPAVAAAVFLLAGRILPACAIGVFPWADACPPAAEAADGERLAALAARRAALEAEVAALQRRVAGLPNCPVVAAAPPPAEPVPEPVPPVAETPPPPPAVEPTPRPNRPPPPPRDIAQDRWDNRDISVLEGCWDLDSDFETVGVNDGSRWPITNWQMCFDANGNGSQSLTAYRDNQRCQGPVRARFGASGSMTIDFVRDLTCNRPGSAVLRRVATCTLRGDGRAQCSSVRQRDQLRQTFVLRRRR